MQPDHPCFYCDRYGWAWVMTNKTHPNCGWYCTACGSPAPPCCVDCVRPVYDFGIWTAMLGAGLPMPQQPRL